MGKVDSIYFNYLTNLPLVAEEFLTPPQTKFLAGFFTNLAAAWFGVIATTPNFAGLTDSGRLTKNFALFILCSILAIRLEEKLI